MGTARVILSGEAMRIKISKSQWEKIGRTAGWLVVSQNIDRIRSNIQIEEKEFREFQYTDVILDGESIGGIYARTIRGGKMQFIATAIMVDGNKKKRHSVMDAEKYTYDMSSLSSEKINAIKEDNIRWIIQTHLGV